MAQAEMNPGAEGDMPIRPPLKIKLSRMFVRLRIEVPGCQHGHDFVPLLQPDAAKLDVLSHEARLGELHRGNEPYEFLDGKLSATPILFQPIAEFRGCAAAHEPTR